MNWFGRNGSTALSSAGLIPLSILLAKALEILFRVFNIELTSPPDAAGNRFVSNFIEWFGVLYGILLPLILVRVWEQLDAIDREFDREADTIKILYEDLSYLSGNSANIGKEIAALLREYVQHVIENYPKEVKQSGTERKDGDKILEQIREQFRRLVHPSMMKTKVSEFLTSELFERLNEAIDIRGDRIALASQRLFESLRLVALITSIIFIIPFYFAGLIQPTGILDVALIIGVTLLVIFIYSIIEDLDGPFDGTWKITDEAWRHILNEMNSDAHIVEQEKQIREVLYKESQNNKSSKTATVSKLSASQKTRKKAKGKK